MSLFRRFYELLFEKTSAAIDQASEPEEKIRVALHELNDSGPMIKAAVAGPIAEANRLAQKRSDTARRLEELEGKASAAVAANNTEVARIRAGEVVDKRRELADIDSRLAIANEKANEARERYEEWKRKSAEMQQKAMVSLDENRRVQAQEQFNSAMAKFDDSNMSSSVAQAIEGISDRAARADAAASLDDDPNEAKLREFDKHSRQSDIDDVLKEFQPKADSEAA